MGEIPEPPTDLGLRYLKVSEDWIQYVNGPLQACIFRVHNPELFEAVMLRLVESACHDIDYALSDFNRNQKLQREREEFEQYRSSQNENNASSAGWFKGY